MLLHGCGALGAIGEDFEQIFEVSREVTEQYKGKRSMGASHHTVYSAVVCTAVIGEGKCDVLRLRNGGFLC